MNLSTLIPALTLFLAAGVATAGPASSFTDFSNGAAGWDGNLPHDGTSGSWIDTSMGNGAPALRSVNEAWGIDFFNRTNANVLGDYSKLGSVTIGLDVIANSIRFRGEEVMRNLVVELRDYATTPDDVSFTSVWFNLGSIDFTEGWQHLSVTIADTTAAALPAGWGGAHISDAHAGPSLPSGRSFADVLANVDELRFSTYVPGQFYEYTEFDIAIDNVSVLTSEVPEPSTSALLLGGVGLLAGLIRRRKRSVSPS